jgi:hypothetical protein
MAPPVDMCDVGSKLEPPAGPNGAASITLAHTPFAHILSPSQSLSEAQVVLDKKEDAVALATSSSKSVVALGVGPPVSSCIRLNCCSSVVGFGVSWEVVVVVADGRLEVVAGSRLDAVDDVVGS